MNGRPNRMKVTERVEAPRGPGHGMIHGRTAQGRDSRGRAPLSPGGGPAPGPGPSAPSGCRTRISSGAPLASRPAAAATPFASAGMARG